MRCRGSSSAPPTGRSSWPRLKWASRRRPGGHWRPQQRQGGSLRPRLRRTCWRRPSTSERGLPRRRHSAWRPGCARRARSCTGCARPRSASRLHRLSVSARAPTRRPRPLLRVARSTCGPEERRGLPVGRPRPLLPARGLPRKPPGPLWLRGAALSFRRRPRPRTPGSRTPRPRQRPWPRPRPRPGRRSARRPRKPVRGRKPTRRRLWRPSSWPRQGPGRGRVQTAQMAASTRRPEAARRGR
mmetsp:Transcript_100956/g.268384  ORF Transcript_100956/g.268384 Transcript_100956/m.268384 type:complete len:242 (+) Transcript_100956:371-1096(+)